MLVVRFYVALDQLVTEATFVPDFLTPGVGTEGGWFVGRYYSGFHGFVRCEDLTEALHKLIQFSENDDRHDQVTDWIGA